MRILEISSSAAAGYAGRLLLGMGFDVERIDASTDAKDPAREVFLHRGKPTGSIDRLETYDVVIEDVGRRILRRLGTSHRALKNGRSLVSVSSFGLNGPYAEYAATDLNVQALGGVLHASGFDDEAPRRLPGDVAGMIAGVHAATAAAAAVFGARNGRERRVHVDISAQDTFMQHWTRHVAQFAYSGTLVRREPKDAAGLLIRHSIRAKDGWIFMLALRTKWQAVARFLGLERFIIDEETTEQPWETMAGAVNEVVGTRGRYDWFAEAAAERWTFAPMEEIPSLLDGPQNTARAFFETVEIDGREVAVPTMPYRVES